MKKKSIGIVVPFYNTPLWVQTSIFSLVNSIAYYKNLYAIEILLVDNTPEEGTRSLKKSFIDAIKLVPELADKITVLKNPEIIKFHGTALDTAVRYFDTDYLLCWESDITIFDSKWLSWIMSHVEDEDTWMSGYEFTDYNGSRDTIVWYVMPNPGIYKMDILKKINNEVEKNSDCTHYWGENYSLSEVMCENSRPQIQYKKDVGFVYGVFSEKRGFKETHLNCPDGKGRLARPNAFYYENGQWLFYKMMRDYPELKYKTLTQDRKLESYNGELTPAYSDFGNGKFKHYWAGTRSWDFLIHPEQNCSQINYVREKIENEIKLWKQIVPERIRKIIPDVFNSCRNDEFEIANLRCIHDNKLGNERSQQLSLSVAEWYKKEFLDSDFNNLME